jgi:hypothetical protein
MAACTQYFYAEDGAGSGMPVNVQFDFYELKSGEWVYGGSYTIPAGTYRTLDLDNTKKYKAIPPSISGYTTPSIVEFFGCAKDVTFVYVKTCPSPSTGDVYASEGTPDIGDTVSFWRDGEYGGDGQYIVARLWEFGDGDTATTSAKAILQR